MNLSMRKLVVPIFLDMFLHFITLIINTYMVTKVSVHLVGAMGAGNQVMDLFMTIFNFLGIGCSVVVAQALGAKKNDLASNVIHASITSNTLFGIFSAIVIYVFGYNILNLLNVPKELINDSFSYLHILGFALLFDGIGMVLAAVLRVYNLATAVMLTSVLMNVITILGNAISLFSWFDLPNLGLQGVALSTLVGRLVGIFVLAYMLSQKAKVKIYFKKLLVVPFEILKKILSIGLPSAGENLLWMAQYMVAFGFVASMGEASLSVQTIYFQITLLILLCGASISVANEVIVGHLVGASEFNEAYTRTFRALRLGVFITLVVVLIAYALKYQIMDALNLNENLRAIMLPLFTLSIFLEAGRTFNIVIVNALRASGDAKFPLITGLIFMWGLSLPLGYFLGIYLGWGIIGIWIGFCADEWLRGLANTWRWRSKKWQEKRLV
ncbi:MATE family efflux transporter [Campylobacter concisus]|jgi:MATE efflux family protein|uniref:MATE family efflux transporter n=1 Tax=Campylobacter concisus TaxID=199 RepID=UPI000A06F7B0|nr:MATE family efflux transporter [Campylobacter concisus]ORI07088.1 MATE family efflux transporter [Campylobacter concisus]